MSFGKGTGMGGKVGKGFGFAKKAGAVPDNLAAQPGTYRVTLTVNGKSYVGSITVRADPMLAGG
jgi:hypothetical protein